jgi:autophagy-related protein 5
VVRRNWRRQCDKMVAEYTRSPVPHSLTCRRRHWPIGSLYDNHTISARVAATVASTYLNGPDFDPTPAEPLRLTLHLASPPNDKLFTSPTAEACKQAFMGQIKEADFLRWGNTKRVTSLRKQDQDGMWEGLRDRA